MIEDSLKKELMAIIDAKIKDGTIKLGSGLTKEYTEIDFIEAPIGAVMTIIGYSERENVNYTEKKTVHSFGLSKIKSIRRKLKVNKL